MCAQIFTAEESGGRNGRESLEGEEEEAGGATVGQDGEETGLYQPKGEEKTTNNDGEEEIDGTGGEEER